MVVQDLDRPLTYGAFWGEVNSNVHRALGCVGTITDGAVRDIDEMTNAGFKAIARRLCVGHAYSTPVEWGCEVFVFGTAVRPGQLIHADKHGFIIIPGQCEDRILDAAVFMDHNECNTLIKAARLAYSKTGEQIVAEINSAARSFGAAANEKFK
ncbi:hypothetical protein SDC9_206579 [bioreactor metagenome]|uniref:4-hydroxy-2-oxoglutarate aldolase n=1 Tax=bioreactor metagenome TaxID=1076179 RepID=A0A645JGZ9_9ZZZZ